MPVLASVVQRRRFCGQQFLAYSGQEIGIDGTHAFLENRAVRAYEHSGRHRGYTVLVGHRRSSVQLAR